MAENGPQQHHKDDKAKKHWYPAPRHTVKEIRKEERHVPRESYSASQKLLIVVCFIIYAAFVFVLSFSAAADVNSGLADGAILVIIGTFPVLIYLLVNFSVMNNYEARKFSLWLLPVILSLLLLLIWISGIFPVISGMYGPGLAVLSAIVCYIFAFLLMLPSEREKVVHSTLTVTERAIPDSHHHPVQPATHSHGNCVPREELIRMRNRHDYEKRRQYYRLVQHYTDYIKEMRKKHGREQERIYEEMRRHFSSEIAKHRDAIEKLRREIRVNADNFPVQLMSIEDKCKAINSAIGRVYSNPNGGSEEARDAIRIPSELYNAFSDIKREAPVARKRDFFSIIEMIYEKLKALDQRELDLFILSDEEKKKIKRDPDGKDTIIQVLARNDKDPVKEYHQQAKSICISLLDYLRGK